VEGNSNEMFSDFQAHRIGGPQLFPVFGVGTSNMIYDGPGQNEDFGFEQTEGDPAARYTFRTAPLRNLKVAPAFFHNGAFSTILDAIRHHFDVPSALAAYGPTENGVPADLAEGPYDGILAAGLDASLPTVSLDDQELSDLADFVENGLLDPKVLDFCTLVPASVPSGMSLPTFTGCQP
jgi:cytochrome c peroxidase